MKKTIILMTLLLVLCMPVVLGNDSTESLLSYMNTIDGKVSELLDSSSSIEESKSSLVSILYHMHVANDNLVNATRAIQIREEEILIMEMKLKKREAIISIMLIIAVFRVILITIGYILSKKGKVVPVWIEILM